MIQRCYSKKFQAKHPAYIGCSVCDEWKNYQNFAEWCISNYYEIQNEKMQLDKDILIKGNKIYSPDTCVFVPQRINKLFIKSNKSRGEHPIGVSYDKNRNKFTSQCSKQYLNNIGYLGSFETELEAFNVYKEFKENYIKQVADEYKDKIPKKLYYAMYNWKVEITD